MVPLKQAFACANTAKYVAALEMVLCIWHISLDRDLGRTSAGCVKRCVASWPLTWKIEDIWMPLIIPVLTCLPPEKWAALFWQKTLTLLVEASALPVPTGPPWLAGSVLELQMLTSAAVWLGHAPIVWVTFGRASTGIGRKKSQLVSGPVQFWGSKWFWSCTVLIALVPVC